MFALPVLVALLVGQPFPGDEPPRILRGIRAGAGALALLDVDGIAPTAEAGVELVPSDRVSLRLMAGAAVRYGWGTFYLAPDVAWRPLQREGGFVPYVAAGVHAGTINITPGALDLGPRALRSAAGAAPGPGEGPGDPLAGRASPAGESPLEFTLGPQASVGAELQLGDRTRVDLALRYTMLRWDGDVYNGFGFVLTFLGPSR